MQESDLNLLIRAAREAGEIALPYHGGDALDVVDKPGGAGPVTAADLAVDAHLVATLRGARSDYGWLSEETPDDPARLGLERVFVVDPIDGTRSFIEQGRTWAHSLAIVERGRPVAGVVYLPARDMLYAAARGMGATLNGAALAVSARTEVTGASIVSTKPTFQSQHWRGAVPAFARHYRPSLAYRLCVVAEGRFDAMLTLRPTWEWDIAAGALIAEEAGAIVSDRSGAPLLFNSATRQTAGCLVANPVLHGQVRDALA